MNKRLIIENEIKNIGIRLPNGTVNKKYLTSFNLPAAKISGVALEGAERLGLAFSMTDDGVCTVSGRPSTPGDYTLRLRFLTVDGEPASVLPIPVAFNPDPRTLWRNIPTPLDTPFYKQDSESLYLQVDEYAGPRKNIVAASQRGRSHAQEGKPRDDHFAVDFCHESGWYIIAVADGAGSARYSRKGSQVACEAVVEHCHKLLADNQAFEDAVRAYDADKTNVGLRTAATRHVIDIIYGGALKAHEAVKQTAASCEGSALRDFATTLMFAICKKYEFGWFLASFWVGDGAICLFDAERHTAKLLGTPDEGEFSGQTRFLTMPEIFRDKDVVSRRLRMAIVPDFTALFLMTDGVSDPMFETERNLNDFGHWERFYRSLVDGFPADGIGGVDLPDNNERAAAQLLAWLDFWSPGNHDDRTIAILH